jgi:LysM repeat protein
MSIILEFSLIMGVLLYGLIHSDSQVNEGGLIQSTEVDSLLSAQEEEIAADEDNPPTGEGGPYMVAPVLHVSTYRAKNGDNLWTVAEKSGLDFYTLLSVNRLKKANEISIGQELKIPNQRGILHTVYEGETLEDIALKYDVRIRKIIRVNQILDPNEIKQGSDLFIPGATVTLAFSKELLKNSGVPPQFAWPCRRSSRISSRFGYRKDPFTGRRAFHNGLDFAPGYGASVYASISGVVTHAGWMGGYGRLIVIRHANGYSTRYGHLSRVRVKKGKYIRQGQQIGNVGNTGRSKGAHLHFEIRRSGKPLNPKKFVLH